MPTQTSSTSASSRRPAAPDALTLLKADHAEVKTFYKQYEKLVDEAASAAKRLALATRICKALALHAQVEDEIFYPAARAAISDQDIMNHADVEHASAKDLIAQIEAMGPEDSHYDAKVCVLCEYVAHHVKEEEREMFPLVRKAKLDLKALGAEMLARKQVLMRDR